MPDLQQLSREWVASMLGIGHAAKVEYLSQRLGELLNEAGAERERLGAMVATLEREKVALLGKFAELQGQRRALREALEGVLNA